MGRVRRWKFDAVIGIGGCGREAIDNGIAEKINWIGIGPRIVGHRRRGPILAFTHFVHYGTKGHNVWDVAPALAARMYHEGVRATTWFDRRAEKEIEGLLAEARCEQQSRILSASFRPVRHRRCRSGYCYRTQGVALGRM
jgi:hypothetical protein